MRQVRLLLCGLFVSASVVAIGCGGGDQPSPATIAELALESELTDLGQLYSYHVSQKRRPPAKFDDLASISADPPLSVADGRVTVFWSTPVSSGNSTTILAHEADAATQGGWVLMTDCKTVKRLSAEEFAAAAKGKK